MDPFTQRRLNAINREFYLQAAGEFDQTRQRPWRGWQRLLQALDVPVCSVLDLGCGNGRFALFLARSQASAFKYIGIDSSPPLLAAARVGVEAQPAIDSEFQERDLVWDGPPEREAQLVTLFGLMHHVPGYQKRMSLLRAAADCVAPGGCLAWAAWRFYELDRFRNRIVPWPDELQVEKHDYLLDWRRGERALRYCHYINDEEHDALIRASGLTVIADYRADGAGGKLNRYTVLRRETGRNRTRPVFEISI